MCQQKSLMFIHVQVSSATQQEVWMSGLPGSFFSTKTLQALHDVSLLSSPGMMLPALDSGDTCLLVATLAGVCPVTLGQDDRRYQRQEFMYSHLRQPDSHKEMLRDLQTILKPN